MTSLTGCSGEGFASILKALGFESVTVRRSEIIWPAAAAPVAAPEETAAAPGADVETADVSHEDSAETACGPDLESADGAHEGNPDDRASTPAAAISPSDPAPGEAASLDADATVSELSEASSEAEAAPSDPPQEAETSGEAEGTPSDLPQQIETTAEVPAEPQPEVAPPTTEDETVTVWRFARAPAPSPHPRPPRPPRRRFPAPGEPRVQPQGAVEASAAPTVTVESPPQDAPARHARPERPRHGGKRKTWDTTRTSDTPKTSDAPKTWDMTKASDTRKTWDATKTWDPSKTQRGPDDKREGREATGGRSGGDRKPVVDPTSPFAKLMELRSILESEGKGKKRN